MSQIFIKNYLFFISILLFSTSCSFKSQIYYLKDSKKGNIYKVDYLSLYDNIEAGDVLKIDIQTIIPEAAIPYINISDKSPRQNLEIYNIEGYVVNESKIINFPVIGDVSVENLNESQVANKIKMLLIEGKHLTNPHVKVRRVNSKFTVLGEVRNPGTFSYYDKNLNIFQALGYAGDITIDGTRKNITLIREENSLRKVYEISLIKSELLNKPFYQIKNNDIIMVKPNYSKVKSAGFIGSPQSIASLASLLLSITLLIVNQ